MNRYRRRIVLGAMGATFLRPMASGAAKSDGPRRIGILFPTSDEGSEAFRSAISKALRARGWVDGRDIVFEMVVPQGDPTAADVSMLLGRNVEVIVTAGTARTRVLRNATRTIPIVTTLTDPVSSGFAESIARPGGNVTGVAHGIAFEKRIDLIRQLVPDLKRLGIFVPPRDADLTRAEIAAAKAVGISATVHWAKDVAGMEREFRTMRWKDRAAVDFWDSPEQDEERARTMLRLAVERGVATIVPPEGVALGGLVSCESFFTHEEEIEAWAAQVDQILRGANPAEIPFRLPTRTRVAINLRTAAALKLSVPPAVLLQAERVIQ